MSNVAVAEEQNTKPLFDVDKLEGVESRDITTKFIGRRRGSDIKTLRT
jgi:hypothetical protein